MGFIKSIWDGLLYMLTSLLMIPILGYKLISNNKSEPINASSAVDDMTKAFKSMQEVVSKIDEATSEATGTTSSSTSQKQNIFGD